MARVFVTRKLPGTALERLSAKHEVEVWPGELPPPRDELLAGVADAEGLLSLLSDRVDTELIDSAPKLRAVANYAIGFDNIDLEAAAARGIQVGNTPDVLTDATADLAWALMLAAARRIVEAHRAVVDGEWRTWEPEGWVGVDVHGATLAVIGAGRIGRAVAERATGFAMDVVTVDLGDDLHAALERADFVSVHTPLTPETRHLIDAETLAVMKPTAILVNTARGPIIDEKAMVRALKAKKIAGAGLDVFEQEPKVHAELKKMRNVVLNPHLGSAVIETREEMANIVVDNIEALLAGKKPPNIVNLDVLK